MSKEAITEYLAEVNEKVWETSKSMQDYEKKICSDVFKSEGGYLVMFRKPEIKKHFCFGHGYCGITTQEETQRAFDNAENARTNENYFISENLEDFERDLKELEETDKVYLMPSYRMGTKIAYFVTDDYFRIRYGDKDKVLEVLSDADVEKLKQTVLSEKAKFVKRLNTYLKRYGLSKVRSWTYLVD